ncbi:MULTISPECIES: hypothetical protein [Actinokineospora]|uniref:Uncharacterized protein n=1 Tax=Actinokineospora fastidiosa TaxID=1816 RepID=A0A918LFI3_9PSEU|nr:MULTISPECIES: hypothetical protein [Actinokineospora]UVS77877.1 hypothetical protein Actkin_01600 [Actinokineospora sp. UTMC 2448]GGS40382.1 hypothetical protein GCM10010171_38560 [Actinokineospora fastidiosa]
MAFAPITEASAVARFPELAQLAALRTAGWRFRPLADDRGGLLCIAGCRCHRLHTDALYVFDRFHVVGVRLLEGDGGGVVWLRDGSDLTEIVRDLIALPAPGEPGAPNLVMRPNALWLP